MSSLTERAHEADEEPARLPVVALPARAGRCRWPAGHAGCWPGYTRSREEGSSARQAARGTRCRSLGSNGGWDISNRAIHHRIGRIPSYGHEHSPDRCLEPSGRNGKERGARPQKMDGDGADDTQKIRETLWKREIRAPYSGGVFLSDDRRWEGNCSQLPRLDCKAQPGGKVDCFSPIILRTCALSVFPTYREI
jgi:hypothetical protein